MSGWQTCIAIVGLGAITLLTRGFFLIFERELPLPDWLRQGLRYAPLAALAAVVVPSTVMTDGHLIESLKDARIYAALVGVAWFYWRRGILGTIVCGTATMLALRLIWGW